MDEQPCPFCDEALTELSRNTLPRMKRLWCNKCEFEFAKFPPENIRGVQRTGLHILLPLDKFSKPEWEDFLFGNRNIYGDPMPARLPVFSSPEEKEDVTKEQQRILQERREWEEKVG